MNEEDDDYDEDESCIKRRLPSIFAWLLLILSSSAYFTIVLPSVKDIMQYGAHNLHVLIAIYASHGLIFFFVVINYLIATFMDPGRFPKVDSKEQSELDKNQTVMYKNATINDITVRMKWCTTCQFYRPPRSSHCAICDYCIDTMDHHCPWLSNCVGKRNYKYFLQFLLFLTVHMIIIFTLCLINVLYKKDNLTEMPVIVSLILIVVVSLLFIPIGGLSGFHLVLVSRGRTTNEQVTGKFRSGVNPFDMGFCTNWRNSICLSLSPNYILPKSKMVKKYRHYKLPPRARDVKQIPASLRKTDIEIPIKIYKGHMPSDLPKSNTNLAMAQLTKQQQQQKRIPNGRSTNAPGDDDDYDEVYEDSHFLNHESPPSYTSQNQKVWIDRREAPHKQQEFANGYVEKLMSENEKNNRTNNSNRYVRNDSYLNANRNSTGNPQQRQALASKSGHLNITMKPSSQTKSGSASNTNHNAVQDYASYEITV